MGRDVRALLRDNPLVRPQDRAPGQAVAARAKVTPTEAQLPMVAQASAKITEAVRLLLDVGLDDLAAELGRTNRELMRFAGAQVFVRAILGIKTTRGAMKWPPVERHGPPADLPVPPDAPGPPDNPGGGRR